MQEKDEATVKLAAALAKAVVVPPKPGERTAPLPDNLIKPSVFEGLPEPGHILIEELVKVLYLNNQDPNKVRFVLYRPLVHRHLLGPSVLHGSQRLPQHHQLRRLPCPGHEGAEHGFVVVVYGCGGVDVASGVGR